MGWLPGSECIFWGQMDEKGGNTVYDQSGKGNDAVNYGALYRRGQVGWCLEFDGVDDYVHIPNISLGTSDFTIEFYFNPQDPTLHRYLVASGDADWQWMIGISYARPRRLSFWLGDGTSWAYANDVYGPTDLEAGRWYHVFWVREGGVVTSYLGLNKEVETTIPAEAAIPGTTARIARMAQLIWIFPGMVDEVRIYLRALTEEERRAHYYYRLTRAVAPPQGRGG